MHAQGAGAKAKAAPQRAAAKVGARPAARVAREGRDPAEGETLGVEGSEVAESLGDGGGLADGVSNSSVVPEEVPDGPPESAQRVQDWAPPGLLEEDSGFDGDSRPPGLAIRDA